MSGWAHHVLHAAATGDVEFALGETRYDDGERIGTFLAVAQLDADGRMVRYMVARSPAIAFDAARDVDAALTACSPAPPEAPELIGSECRRCGAVAFPRQGVVRRAARRATSRSAGSRRRGTLWTWTIQCFRPSPRRTPATRTTFEPYGVGYVELPGEVRVEARLTEADPARLRIGMPMELADPGARRRRRRDLRVPARGGR